MSTGNFSKLLDILKDRRNPIWAPYHALKRGPSEIADLGCLDIDLSFSLTVDVEHDFGLPGYLRNLASVGRGISNLMDFLKEINMAATFFILKIISEQFPTQVEEVHSRHEVGIHGYAHECWGEPKWWLRDDRVLKLAEKQAHLAESIEAIEKITSAAPKSFRAPYMVIDTESLKLLDEFGFKVDSSAPSYYGVPPKPYRPHDLSLLEIPVSAYPYPRFQPAPIPHFHFDYLNTKLLATRGVDWCVNFVRRIVKYQVDRDIKPHVVMLAHQWEFVGWNDVPDKSFDYARENNIGLLGEFLAKIEEKFKTEFVTMRKLAKRVSA